MSKVNAFKEHHKLRFTEYVAFQANLLCLSICTLDFSWLLIAIKKISLYSCEILHLLYTNLSIHYF